MADTIFKDNTSNATSIVPIETRKQLQWKTEQRQQENKENHIEMEG
jgi:hypothetical protein